MFSISCSSFLEEDPRDGLLGDNAYSTLPALYRNCVASLYNCVGSYKDSEGLQGTGRGIYDLNTFTTDEAICPPVEVTGMMVDSGKDSTCISGE